MTKTKVKQLLAPSRLVFFFLSLIVFYFAVRHTSQLSQIKDLLLGMSSGWLLLVLVTQVLTYAFNAWILRALLNGKTGTAGFFQLFKISVVVMFVNQLLPSGGISGNGYVFNELVKRKIPAPVAFRALILETLCYYAGFLLLLGSFYAGYCFDAPIIVPYISYTVLAGFVFFCLLGTVVVIISHKRALAFLMSKLSRFRFIKRYLDKLNVQLLHADPKSTNLLHGDAKAKLSGLLLQIGILLLDAITIYALIHGLRANMSFGLMIFGFLVTLVIGSLPTSPGSLIAYEGAMTYFFHILGLPLQMALVVTLLFRFFTFWLPIPIGLFFYRNLQRQTEH